MLSRGVDPSVLDPTQCHHSHPPVPPEWPSRAQLEAYVAGVRRQLLAAVRAGVSTCEGEATGGSGSARVSMRALCLTLEHERMHQVGHCPCAAHHGMAKT